MKPMLPEDLKPEDPKPKDIKPEVHEPPKDPFDQPEVSQVN